MMPNLYFLVSERSCLSSLISDVNLLMAFAISATVDCNDSRSALLLPLQATDSGSSPTLSGFPVSMVAAGIRASLELPSPLFRVDPGVEISRAAQKGQKPPSLPLGATIQRQTGKEVWPCSYRCMPAMWNA